MNLLQRLLSAMWGAKSPAVVRADLDALAAQSPQKLNWNTSVVDLMKLNGMDSSLKARKKMAKDLGYTGLLNGSAEMNMWLHARLRETLAKR